MSTPPAIPPPALTTLTEAASILAAIGRGDPAAVSADVALLCLAAAQQLRTLGVIPQPTSTTLEPIEASISAALALLAGLPTSVFAATAVLDAASHARRAREIAA